MRRRDTILSKTHKDPMRVGGTPADKSAQTMHSHLYPRRMYIRLPRQRLRPQAPSTSAAIDPCCAPSWPCSRAVAAVHCGPCACTASCLRLRPPRERYRPHPETQLPVCAHAFCHSELAGPSLRAVRCSGFNHAPARARSLGAGDRSSLPDNHFHHIASVLTLGHRSAAADGVGLDGRAADPSGNALRLPDRALADELSDWRARPPPRWSLKWRAVPCTHTLAC